MTLWLAAMTGLVAGSAHVVLGPDHLAAVAPIAARSRQSAAQVGALWGLGHGLGVLLFGLLGQLAQGVFDFETLPWWSEFTVGLLLVGLGIWTLHRSRVVVVHSHAHDHTDKPNETSDAPVSAHHRTPRSAFASDAERGHSHVHHHHGHAHGDDHAHSHPHVHIADPTVDDLDHPHRGTHEAHTHSAFGFGLLHGTAGAGHLFGVLPSLLLAWDEAVVYLGAYLVAAVAVMSVFSWLVGLIVRDERRLPLTMQISGIAALLVGVFWVGQLLLG